MQNEEADVIASSGPPSSFIILHSSFCIPPGVRMKVVLFCGGQGLRLRDYSENTPKPMVPIGYRPILWHLMKYYAHYGHKDFILCLGHKADVIKRYFLDYEETLTNDFVLRKGGRDVQLIKTDIDSW